MPESNPKQTELLAVLVAIKHNTNEIERRLAANANNQTRVLELLHMGVSTGDQIRDFCVLNGGGVDNDDLCSAIKSVNERITKCWGQVAMLVRTSWVYSQEAERSIARGSDVWLGVLTGDGLVLEGGESVPTISIPCTVWTMFGHEGVPHSRPWYLPKEFLLQSEGLSMTWEILIGGEEVSARIRSEGFFSLVSPKDYLGATSAVGWDDKRPEPEQVRKYFDGWVAGLRSRYAGAVAVGQEKAFFSNVRLESRMIGFDPEEFLADLTGNIVPKD